ncbi:hypothetical protein OHT61_05820 [Streptomyces sp. NBC_00178]|uniref:hypothetical protein n=1 Tax=Streptomyces sp. NBC_00178 TaxID=2975672 RepID=UPI002E28C36D|nr:hypothetical protein [Streptomyces sp. NBC_00178]
MRHLIPLSPTVLLSPHDRLLLGKPLATALDTADPEAWAGLDRRTAAATARREGVSTIADPVREGHRGGSGGAWDAAPRWDEEAHDVTWSRFPPTEPETALVLCHHRWQAREAALAFTPGRTALLPLVVVRCADSRREVRERARRVLAAALEGDTAPAPGLVPVALRMTLRPHGAWAAERLLAAAGPLSAAVAARVGASPHRSVRLLGTRCRLEDGSPGSGELTESALTARDPAVRHLCTGALLARVTAGDPGRLLDPLLGAPSAVTRSSAVTALHRAGRGREAGAHLADPSAVVRSAARLVLRLEGEDPGARYRELCADGAGAGPAPGALFGLAESGAPDAAALLRPLTAHPEGRLRAAALASLRMLDEVSPDDLMSAMEDPHPPVVRAARKALVPYVLLVPEEWLTSLVAPGRPRHVRRSGLRLLCAHSLALRKRVLAALEDDDDPEVAHEAQRARYEPLPPAGSTS